MIAALGPLRQYAYFERWLQACTVCFLIGIFSTEANQDLDALQS